MELTLLDIDKLVNLNELKPVTNPVSFDKGLYPSKDGLFSEEIFGMTTAERKRTCAYIPLGKKFISPKAYLSLKQLDRKFCSVVDGSKTFSIKDGVLVEDENGDTGIDWLYKNWGKFDFKKTESHKRNQKIDTLTNSKKEEIFIDKFLVVPPFYRDVNLQQKAEGGNPRVPEVTGLYANIIRNANLLRSAGTFDIVSNAIVGKTQDLLVEVYNLWKSKLEKKYGYIRKFLLGKSVSWCSRMVITADVTNCDSPDDQVVDFWHTGVPLSNCISMAAPFIKYWVRRFFKTRLYDYKDAYPVYSKGLGKGVYVKLEDPEVYYNDDYIERQMNRFINSAGSRFDKVEIPVKQSEREKYKLGNDPIYMTFTGYKANITTMEKTDDKVTRHLTWTDIFYLAAIDTTTDKHILITRYPFLDYLNTFMTKIHVLSTRNTAPMIINDVLYEHYPVVDLSLEQYKIESYFIDAFKLNPFYLAGIGGDYDGDQATGKILFSEQANEQAEQLMYSNVNILGVTGHTVRSFGNELIQTLYTLTRFHECVGVKPTYV